MHLFLRGTAISYNERNVYTFCLPGYFKVQLGTRKESSSKEPENGASKKREAKRYPYRNGAPNPEPYTLNALNPYLYLEPPTTLHYTRNARY